MREELEKVYEPKDIEESWLARWQQADPFHAPESSSRDQSYSIVIPPPNVTGVLHMGHALNNTLQDVLCRYKRMKGFNVLWVVGTDHAGIATQNVVERKLAAEGKSRHDLGREKFIEEVWDWKEKHGSHIIHQLQRLGASCDWSRERFTMDEGLSQAVLETFVHLHKKDLIYRDLYLINWCPRCQTALSDLEVEHEDKKGHLWHLRYPYKDGSGEIVVATTRPETMLGDTAVAVHPDDERYKAKIGQTLVLPLVGREIPIIADHRVDKEFGSGAVKITPAHDFNDFMMGNDHKLDRINLLTPDGHMNENAIHFEGLDRFECRRRIVDELEEKAVLLKTEDHQLSVGHCYRCKTVVEPYLSKQWFVKTAPLAERALKAVHDGETTFHPSNWTKTYQQWMENIQPWCISRQIWWGHQIPAWYGPDGEFFVGKTEAEAHEAAASHYGKSVELTRDPDVLDTWFSSGLWPFSTLGWPEQTAELKSYYPTSVLITAFDIIFFWVARMMMMGLELMDEVPFKDVYIHALVRDAEGKKMSKSKGNVIDPLEIMDRFGTDAFRFTLSAMAAQGRDIKLSEEMIQGNRNFSNKIWNASRFAMMNLEGYAAETPQTEPTSVYDFWICRQLKQTIAVVEQALADYKYDVAAKSLYQFFWNDFCDWYLEYSKGQVNQATLYAVLEASLRLLHPFMPFITEEIWHRLTGADDVTSINQQSFPQPQQILSDKLEQAQSQAIDHVKQLISPVIEQIRSIRGENQIKPSAKITTIVYAADETARTAIITYADDIKRMTRTETFEIVSEVPHAKGMARGIISEDLQIFIPLAGLIDFAAERERLQKEIGKLGQEMVRLNKKLSNEKFMARAPEEVVAEEKGKLAAAEGKKVRLQEALENLA